MPTPILTTKLYVPSAPPRVVPRQRLIEQLNEGLHRRLTLISAPAGFGKSTLLSAWVAGCDRPVAWLSLDEDDNDPTRFLIYVVARVPSATASGVDSDGAAQRDHFAAGQFRPCSRRLPRHRCQTR